ncbi:MAG: SCP2 sterol-binding domain-containing protein [Actinomycetota bacterium]|jgi:hypothetical protein|nr:SCP2 sterol-binding domain-containing protein [Actinomycetota bacterium]
MSSWPGTDWPDPGWYDAASAAAGAVAAPGPPFDARVRVDVAGGPAGSELEHWAVRRGRLADGGPGDPGDAELTCAIDAADLSLLHGGTLDPAVAFMLGRLKVAGHPGLVVALISLAHAVSRALAAPADPAGQAG